MLNCSATFGLPACALSKAVCSFIFADTRYVNFRE